MDYQLLYNKSTFLNRDRPHRKMDVTLKHGNAITFL